MSDIFCRYCLTIHSAQPTMPSNRNERGAAYSARRFSPVLPRFLHEMRKHSGPVSEALAYPGFPCSRGV